MPLSTALFFHSIIEYCDCSFQNLYSIMKPWLPSWDLLKLNFLLSVKMRMGFSLTQVMLMYMILQLRDQQIDQQNIEFETCQET